MGRHGTWQARVVRAPTRTGTLVIDEAARNELYNRLEAAIGAGSTSTLMSLLPPVGWADVATKDDLRVLERTMRADLRRGMSDLRADVHNAMRQQTLALIGAMLAISGLTVVAAAVF